MYRRPTTVVYCNRPWLGLRVVVHDGPWGGRKNHPRATVCLLFLYRFEWVVADYLSSWRCSCCPCLPSKSTKQLYTKHVQRSPQNPKKTKILAKISVSLSGDPPKLSPFFYRKIPNHTYRLPHVPGTLRITRRCSLELHV